MTRARWLTTPNGGRLWTATLQRCNCAGYPFPHRKTGGACLAGPRSDYYRAVQAGENKLEALLHLSVDQLERHFPI